MRSRNIADILLYVGLFCILLLFIGIFFRGQKDISRAENRTLEQFPKFTVESFSTGAYQKQLESAIADQLVLGQTMKIKFNEYKTSWVYMEDQLLANLIPADEQTYIAIDENYYLYGDSGYIVEKAYQLDNYKDKIREIGVHYNEAFKGAEVYLYFINNSRTVDFNYPIEETELYRCVRENFRAKKYAYLKVDSFQAFANLFYKTDHHWNYKGSNQGYRDIVQLLLGKDEKLIEPNGIKKFNLTYYGTYARQSSYFNTGDEFILYQYPKLSEHKTYVNGEEVAKYGREDEYLENNFSHEKTATHYSTYYGPSTGEIIYDFNDSSKENLLIVTRSYSVSIRELIASHFNKTYIIDPRHYDFSPQDYTKGKDIDKVLYLGDISTFAFDEIDLK